MEFFQALEEEMVKSTQFFIREINHFSEQLEISIYCFHELELINNIHSEAEKKKRIRQVSLLKFLSEILIFSSFQKLSMEEKGLRAFSFESFIME